MNAIAEQVFYRHEIADTEEVMTFQRVNSGCHTKYRLTQTQPFCTQ